MATPRSKQSPSEFVSREDAERMAQEAAGRVLMTMPEAEPEPLQILEDDPDDVALANVIADLGGPGIDAKVNVYQLDQNRNKSFVRAFMPTEFSLEAVQAEYGPGDYEIHVRKDGKLATRKVIKIAMPKNQPHQNLVPVSGIGDAKILEAMQNGFKEMSAMFATTLSTMAANQPKPKTSMEMLQELQMMRELMGVNQPAAPATDPLQMVELAVQLSEKITPRTGEPGAGEVILEALKNLGPILGQAMQGQRNVPSPVPLMHNPAPVIGNTAPSPVIGSTPQPAAQEPDEMNLAKRMYLNLLVSNAAAGNDTLTYANLMLDVAGEQAALEFANAPDWFERLCVEEPRASQYKEWFGQLRADVMELTKPDEPGNDTITSPSETQP